LTDCIFCKIVAGEIPSSKVAESEHAIAFHDIAPEQPVHILVVPKKHFTDVADLSINDPEQLAHLMKLATEVAKSQTNGHFKLQFNTGSEAGQTVFHVHAHVLAQSAKATVA
jgi:histidine triad (HIT) family protein